MSYREYGAARVNDVKARLLSRCHSEDRGYTLPDATPSRCLIWTGEKDKDGYGRIKRNGKYVPAHWVLSGDPPSGYEKDHLCHQRDCVRPLHLQDATKSVNTLNRRPRTFVLLTPEQKDRVRELLRNGVPRASIVKSTGVSRRTVNRLWEEVQSE